MQDAGKKEDEGSDRERRLIESFEKLSIGYKKVVLSILADTFEHEFCRAVIQEVLIRSAKEDVMN
jgi:hypothetical protein